MLLRNEAPTTAAPTRATTHDESSSSSTTPLLPLPTGKTVALVGKSANSTGDILGNYIGPICHDGTFNCVSTIYAEIKAANAGGAVCLSDGTDVGGESWSCVCACVHE